MKRILTIAIVICLAVTMTCSSFAVEKRNVVLDCYECGGESCVTIVKFNKRADRYYKTRTYFEDDGSLSVYAVYCLYNVYECSLCGWTYEKNVGEEEVFLYTVS